MELNKHTELLGTAKSRLRCKSLPTPFLTNSPNYLLGGNMGGFNIHRGEWISTVGRRIRPGCLVCHMHPVHLKC